MMDGLDVAAARAMLSGGDRRSIGRADAVAALALAGTCPAAALFELMFDEDPVVQMRAADALEKVSAQQPATLDSFKEALLVRLPEVRQAEVRWHVAQMLPRLPLTAEERQTAAVPVLLGYLQDRSRIVQTFALQALVDFATADPALRPQVIPLVEAGIRTGSPAVKSRCRRLSQKLGTAPAGQR